MVCIFLSFSFPERHLSFIVLRGYGGNAGGLRGGKEHRD